MPKPSKARAPFAAAIALAAAATSAANVPLDVTALGTASQTHSHGSGLYPADNATDGDNATFSHTESQSPGAAWEWYLPAERELVRVELVARADCCAGRLDGASLRLYDGDGEEVFEAAITDPGPLGTFTAELPPATFARDLRVGFEPGQSGIIHLAEVRVFAPAGDPPQILTFAASGNTLNWEVGGADAVELIGVGPVAASGSHTVAPPVSTPYVLRATNPCATVTASAAVLIGGQPLPPRITELGAVGNDWFEIWNPDAAPLDLGGWHLTDDPAEPDRHTLPPGTLLAPGAVLLLDAPFGLAREAGSYLALIDPAGATVSAHTYPEQFEGASYGADITGAAGYFTAPTPGALNLDPPVAGFLKGVTFSHARGFYDAPFALELAPQTPGATVLYALGGGEPDTPYTAPLPIATTSVVRAVEVLADHVPARPVAHTFLFLGDVAAQPELPPGVPDDWLPASASGALAPIPRRSDYEMDPAIVAAAPFTDRAGAGFDIPDALRSLPSLCLTLPADQMWDPADGLHANALKRGRAWEREVSMELLDPGAEEGFHTRCGLRVHGGRGRVAEMLKKSFRLYFRGDYGAAKFDHPLFEGLPPGGADHLVLRGGNGKTWASPWRALTGGGNSLPRVTYLRDQFLRDSQRATGQPAFAGTFVHLYINGLYWGLYNPVERPGAPWAANHFGGDEDTDWDFLKWANGLPTQIVHGDLAAWDEVLALVRAGAAANYDPIAARVDLENLADFLIVNFYAGNIDWAATRNNGYTFRSKNGVGDGKFRFLCWDGEESFLNPNQNSTEGSANNPTTPLELHLALRAVPAYQRLFGDRAHRHLVDEGGALRPVHATARHDALADLVDRAMAAESARWGDLLRPDDPYTRDGDWLAEIANITTNYLAPRPATALAQLRDDALYPATAAPVATLSSGATVTLAAPAGEIWFTLDGSDPASSPTAQRYSASPATTALIDRCSTWRYLDDGSAPPVPHWTASAFDDSSWPSGAAPLGYGALTGASLATTIGFGPDPLAKHPSAQFRHRFTAASPGAGTLLLRLFRDDGAAIFLNGAEVARTNLPAGPLDPTTLAAGSVSGFAESEWHAFELDGRLVRGGDNVLAVSLHQDARNSSDLGFDLELALVAEGIPLAGDTVLKARALAGGGWSALEAEAFRALDPAAALVVSEIMYHPADPGPDEIAAGFTEASDFEYLELRNVGSGDLLLDGLRLTRGVDAALTGILRPGEVALVVANQGAIAFRHGAGLPVAATWERGDRLDNGGERILIASADGVPVRDFRYDDAPPWPADADGPGAALALIAPYALPDHSEPGSWRPAAPTPGQPGTDRFPGGDLLAYALGGATPQPTLSPAGALALRFPINARAEDLLYTLQASDDLDRWRDIDAALSITAPAAPDWVSALLTPADPARYLRLKIALRPLAE